MKPYVIKLIGSTTYRTFNPKYPIDSYCICGHQYHRHFDGYESMPRMSCKYCGCHDFIDASNIYDSEFMKLFHINYGSYFKCDSFMDRFNLLGYDLYYEIFNEIREYDYYVLSDRYIKYINEVPLDIIYEMKNMIISEFNKKYVDIKYIGSFRKHRILRMRAQNC